MTPMNKDEIVEALDEEIQCLQRFEGRARMAAAQKARWAKVKRAGK
jgi:hypothetical protein